MVAPWDVAFETMPWPKLQEYWLEHFSELFSRVRASSGFYRKHLEGCAPPGHFEELSALPVVTKQEIREAQLQGDRHMPLGSIQVAQTADIVQVISSSGTTGRPVYYGITRHDLAAWHEALAAFAYGAGIRKEDVVAHVVGTPIFAGGEPYFGGMRHIGATVVWAGGLATQRLFESLRNMYCTAILGTTSFDLYLGEHCKEFLGVEARELGIKKILGGGESGLGEEPIRRRMKELWGAETVREVMGLADVMPGMWAECEEEQGMHFTAPRYVMVELVDPDNGRHRPWELGATGEPVYTTLDREATPLLRYASHDYVQVEGTACRCGRTSPRIRCVGRVDDMLIYKAMNVFPSAIRDVIMRGFEAEVTGQIQVVKEDAAQVRFDSPIPVDVEILPTAVEPARLKRAIEDRVRDTLTVRIEANLVPPDTIQRTAYKSPLIRVRTKEEGRAP